MYAHVNNATVYHFAWLFKPDHCPPVHPMVKACDMWKYFRQKLNDWQRCRATWEVFEAQYPLVHFVECSSEKRERLKLYLSCWIPPIHFCWIKFAWFFSTALILFVWWSELRIWQPWVWWSSQRCPCRLRWCMLWSPRQSWCWWWWAACRQWRRTPESTAWLPWSPCQPWRW